MVNLNKGQLKMNRILEVKVGDNFRIKNEKNIYIRIPDEEGRIIFGHSRINNSFIYCNGGVNGDIFTAFPIEDDIEIEEVNVSRIRTWIMKIADKMLSTLRKTLVLILDRNNLKLNDVIK